MAQYLPPEIREKHVQYIQEMTTKRKNKKIPLSTILDRVRRCTVRKTKPVGPMTVCYDMICFDECIAQTKKDIEAKRKRDEETKNEP